MISLSAAWTPSDPDDPFNPNTWVDEHEHRIYADDNASEWCVVDAWNYAYFSLWKWHVNKPHAQRWGSKRYLVRSTSNGKRYGPKLYLHVEIMKRTGKKPPSPKHKLVDHKDGDEMNCREENLEWVTALQNNRRAIALKRKRNMALLMGEAHA